MRLLPSSAASVKHSFRLFSEAVPKEEPVVESFWPHRDFAEEAARQSALLQNLAAGLPGECEGAETGEETGGTDGGIEFALHSEEIQRRLNDAHREAEKILENARAEREAALEEARKAGHAKGYAEGRERAVQEQQAIFEAKTAEALEEIKQTLEAIDEEKQRLLEDNLAELRDLTVAIAEKVINANLKSSGDVIEKMIRAATERCKAQAWAKIYIARQDAALMVQGDKGILEAMAHITGNVKVVEMDNSDQGDCIIELPDQIIDAGVKTQLGNISELLMRAGDND